MYYVYKLLKAKYIQAMNEKKVAFDLAESRWVMKTGRRGFTVSHSRAFQPNIVSRNVHSRYE
jgi:hypothetical protein